MKEQINPESWSPCPTFSTLTLLTTSFPPCFDFGIEGRLDPEEKGNTTCSRVVCGVLQDAKGQNLCLFQVPPERGSSLRSAPVTPNDRVVVSG